MDQIKSSSKEAIRKTEDAKRKREHYKTLSDGKRKAIQKKNTERRKKQRQKLSDDQKKEINKKRTDEYAAMPDDKKKEINKKRTDKYAAMDPEQKKEINKKRTDEYAAMNPEQKKNVQAQNLKSQRQTRGQTIKEKAENRKGLIADESKWLLTPDFVADEKKKYKSGDINDRNEKGQHYLGEMDQKCGFCNGRGFKSEIQGKVVNPNNPDGQKLVHFGNLCCNRGKVKGISDYNLPSELKELYTSSDPSAVHFREHARTYNNGMAMSSVAAKNGWKTRTHNNKMDSMLTAGGQLFRRMGSLVPIDGERPKCIQTYFYGGEDATKWRMLNTKQKMPAKERATYKDVFGKLNNIMMDADNKYIKSFHGVKEYVETHLKDKVWDVKLSIHANESPDPNIHKGRLNAPTVNEIAILLPSDDGLTESHKR